MTAWARKTEGVSEDCLMTFSKLLGHMGMLLDDIRMQAYRQAIHATVRVGDVVADLGTGSGIMAFFAVQAGAKQVFAIEREDIIAVAQRLAEHNGMADRIIFIKGSSDQVDLPEPVDVIISEIIGVFGLEEELLDYTIDFRDRCLKTGGALVPAWLDLYLIPVESQELWDTTAGMYREDFYGVDFSAVRSEGCSERYILNRAVDIRKLADESPIAHFDFYQLTKVPSTFAIRLPIRSGGIMHGWLGYFKVGLSPQVILSTSPDDPATHWSQSFFPLAQPTAVQAGDVLECKFAAFHLGKTFWKWDTTIISATSPPRSFSQNNFRWSKKELLLNTKDYAPALSLTGEIRRFVLEACNGQRTMADIAKILQEAFPEQFKNMKAAYTEINAIVSDKLLE